MNPYRTMPPRAFWSRAVATGLDPAAIADVPVPLIRRGDRVISAGNCFAANLVPYLEAQGFSYLRTEQRHPAFAALPEENLSYAKFSAAYGNIYTVRQLLQLLQRVNGRFTPSEDRWHGDGVVIDPFRPGLRYTARSDREFNLLTRRHLLAVRRAMRRCTVFIFTLGLTEAWMSSIDGAVYPACPGTIAGTFDAKRHVFKHFTAAEVIADLDAAIAEFRTINEQARIILTVSPVPLVATATDRHVLAATIYSKSVLRVAAEHGAAYPNVVYFPSYAIVTSPASPERFFEADRRTVSREAIDTVMAAFLSRALADLECEEAAQDAS